MKEGGMFSPVVTGRVAGIRSLVNDYKANWGAFGDYDVVSKAATITARFNSNVLENIEFLLEQLEKLMKLEEDGAPEETDRGEDNELMFQLPQGATIEPSLSPPDPREVTAFVFKDKDRKPFPVQMISGE